MLQNPSSIALFRHAVLADDALQAQLGSLDDRRHFVEASIAAAAVLGLSLLASDLEMALQPDPLGLARLSGQFPLMPHWPSSHWLPTHVGPMADGRLVVDWSYFGDWRLDEPFFEMSVMRVAQRPFNRLLSYRMTLDDFLAFAPIDYPAPRGFIFHMSRCGSTLAAQMLAAVPHHIVVSEASPLDVIVQLNRFSSGLSISDQARVLKAMVAALGRRRFEADGASFFKLDSWHVLSMLLFRDAFPSVPWVYLYREPLEVMVSQMRQRGLQTVPGALSPALYGINDAEVMSGEEYCARVLDRICAAAADHVGGGNGLLINYEELPDAVFTKILPHFGISVNASDLDAMEKAARQNAKAPYVEFASDRDGKRRDVTSEIRQAVARYLSDSYQRLETLRLAAVA